MNISQPISSSVETVEFTFLTEEEIRAVSVKRIENDSTFDNLLNPVPGGLYDPALGSWGDALCATCNLNQSSCPGHAGHIELPVPVYHPIFLDQVLRLLRSQCAYCKGFRMRHRESNRFSCKLRLLQHGLLHEAHLVDAIGEELKSLAMPGVPTDYDSEAEEEGTSTVDNVIGAREAFVRQSLKAHKLSLGEVSKGKHEGSIEMRRELIKEFMVQITKPRKCDNCGGISPAYRKDRFVKIFEKALSERDLAHMAQRNLHMKDSMATTAMTSKSKTTRGSDHADEGVADVDLASSEENDVEMRDASSSDEHRPMDKGDEDATNVSPGQQRYISAMEVRARLRELFEKEQEIMSLIYNSKPVTKKVAKITADMFFLRTILVPPNKFRPEARTGDSISEAQQNSLYKNILRNCVSIARIHQNVGGTDQYGRARDISDLHQIWTELQESVNSLIDKSKNPVQGAAAKRNEDGIKQKLEKKEGLFRKNMMGKRVNFAARSVISPDPNIETNEIGVPPVFARKLTYPEPVTSHNFRDMQQAVINGVDKWPGAAAIEYENGQIVNLRSKSTDDRVSLANQLLAPTNNQMSGVKSKKVYRHLTNGDVVLMNRQPTLHKPSIMGHRVRVLPGEKTIRMHYANCNTYNADFDGDEMNMHFPQNEVARAEALQIADTDHQYLSGTAGKPLRGLIQDHLSVSVALCNKDTFFDRDSYQQLIYSALRPESGHILGERIELIPPAIIKPIPRWTGKQVVTTILKNIKPPNGEGLWMTGKSQVKGEQWGKGSEEGTVLFQDGQFLSGILDKAQLGPSSGGLIHAIHEIYGPAVAGKLLSGIGRLLTRYLNMRAFTCGMDDLRLTPQGEVSRKETLKAAKGIGLEVAARYVSLEDNKPGSDDPELLTRLEEVMRDDSKQEGLDMLMNQSSAKVSSMVTAACLPVGLVKQFPKNQMQSMTTSGAKGGQVNANLISCNLGQQVLEGRRVPLMVSGKSLPCFRPFETDVRAGGYIVQRFLTGIRPQEYYFHHMAGREGLIDTAVKTSRSGYLQRCIIKGMEGLTVSYDSTVRDADGTLVQCLYGEDGLDPTKQKYLTDFGFVLRNIGSETAQLNFGSEFKDRFAGNKDDVLKHMKSAIKHAKVDIAAKDPIISLVNPARVAFATSEQFYEKMSQYIKNNEDGLIRDKSKDVSGLINAPAVNRKSAELVLAAKYMRSLVEAGEGVGIVAGQSVGEPSTQMTLNTFHLAGHSAKNVTLGIPRLREILMTASRSISTPSMTLLLHEELSATEGEIFAKSISVLPLADVLDTASVNERIGKGQNSALAKLYDVRLNFFPSEEYTKTYAIDASDVMDTVEKRFLDHLLKTMTKEIKKRRSESNSATPDIGAKAGVVEMATGNGETRGGGDDNDDDDDDGDGDATNAKNKANREEAVSYGPNDDEDDAIQRQMEREESVEEDEGFGGSPVPETRQEASDEEEEEAEDDESESEGAWRAERVKERYLRVTRFSSDEAGEWCEFTLEFEADTPKVLMLNIVQAAVKKSVIQQIPGVGSCTFTADHKTTDPITGKDISVPAIYTSGANLRAMQKYGDFINPNKIATNDIAAVLDVYGVEACRTNIVSELAGVFGGHGISVDNRHLNLIADYMTRNGDFTPFNRNGLRGNISPFTKMSFETTLSFLKDAVLDGDWDDLRTPSSRIVMGRLGRIGTGAFDVLTALPTHHMSSHAE
ncbi:DNA-directed RNA polymerase I subunit RPA190 [Colletotrichum fructicola]|uniref:DNA-directed RNA polymerase subunit n=1 Tax=Colletotrichum fructicola (strain Nara gc5) TaxID=1213859 RepID=L2FR02_COLFN|nr:DNA-directed RNA polymerase I subunit [Colletotrichum fructicola]KAF4482141.1 DNA-directed RNA polymerase I subunit RPA190 [Colletotrichum fructicola Nara gc5]KAE9573016.1 DNA-directed RNA polymerase I subunit [Colletotrichum fructicola]KAF4413596.1 DNA-directed RNA polymerase I subunit RPA190 [Colletotrichum fructicola]KAF4884711.1 DNA-directed RNA polymerase I subunit RPA190 [Colletotrichum fructicola]KAF4891947.1 DNA-directed RNA polymerase I subunit RPA190 [Colletotrichum fructicola]